MAGGRGIPQRLSPASNVMTETPTTTQTESGRDGEEPSVDRIFLCVIDSTDEVRVAIRFASRRAWRTGGRVAMLYVMEPADFQHWISVEEKMREERRAEAERVLQERASEVYDICATMLLSGFRCFSTMFLCVSFSSMLTSTVFTGENHL